MFGYRKNVNDSQELINLVSSNSSNCLNKIKNLIESKNYNSTELNMIEDSYQSNLLYLAVMNLNVEVVEYLLEKGLNASKKNKFNFTPWNIALTLNNNEIIEKFVLFRIKTENNDMIKVRDLTNVNDTLKMHNQNLINSCKDLTNENLTKKIEIEKLKTNNIELTTSNKRLISELTYFESDNKKLKTENTTLKEKNEKLKKSVDNLINNARK